MKNQSPVSPSTAGAAPREIGSASATISAGEPTEEDIRAYAYHLYVQSNGAPGHDLDNWFEATACLKSAIPADGSHHRLHRHLGAPIHPAVQLPLSTPPADVPTQ